MEQIKNNNDFKITNEIFENIFQIESKIREYNNIIQKEEGQKYNHSLMKAKQTIIKKKEYLMIIYKIKQKI